MGCINFYVYNNMTEWAVNVNRFALFEYLRLMILLIFFKLMWSLRYKIIPQQLQLRSALVCRHAAVKVAHAPCCACVFSCRGSRLGPWSVMHLYKVRIFKRCPCFHFGGNHQSGTFFFLRLILNTLKPLPLLQVNTDFFFLLLNL